MRAATGTLHPTIYFPVETKKNRKKETKTKKESMNTKKAGWNAALIVLALIGMSLGLGLGIGCSHLEPGGAYAPTATNAVTGEVTATAAPDKALFLADSAYKFAWTSANAAFELERENEALLFKISPNIKHELDKIRVEAMAADLDFHRARSAYVVSPTPAGLSQVEAALSTIKRLAKAAAALLPAS